MVQPSPLVLEPPHYGLSCSRCGAKYTPDPFRLHCDVSHEPALLQTIYSAKTIDLQPLPGIFQFKDWLPVDRSLDWVGKPITYESTHLGPSLGLKRLYVSFNGYWPERLADLMTGSFKELEAQAVLARVPQSHNRTMVLASAGNTGRAFATLCSALQVPLVLVIPEQSLAAMWSKTPFHPCVCLITVTEGSDYSDAIALAHLISQRDEYFPEGGVANVARRDGMGLTVLDAALALGRIPDHYFQAVGSGSGGIAAWETSRRLQQDGRFGDHRMQLHLAQNLPFIPMVDAWKGGMPQMHPLNEAIARSQIDQVAAKVLTNRTPAYAVTGGVYDALVDTGGHMYAVTNEDATEAQRRFEVLEGIDISVASGVATAALIQAIQANRVGADDLILLNITSGGICRMQRDYSLHYLRPTLTFAPNEIRPDIVNERMDQYC